MSISPHRGSLFPTDGSAFCDRERGFDALPANDLASSLLDALNERALSQPVVPVAGAIALAGDREATAEAERLLARIGVPVAAVIDLRACDGDDPERLSAVGAPGQAALVAVVPTAVRHEAAVRALSAAGWTTILPFADLLEAVRERHPLSAGWRVRRLSRRDLDRAQAVMAGWSDGASRAHHLQFAAWRMLRAEWQFDGAAVRGETAFFIPEVLQALPPDASLLDVGAYHGALCRRFAERPGGQFGHILAVEPDPTARAVLAATVESLGRAVARRVTVADHVLGATIGPVPFAEGYGRWSRCGDGGMPERAAQTVDALAFTPSLMTIDVNGQEIAVLEGAVQTLDRARPVVAVEVSGSTDGLWRTAEWMMKRLEGYRFLMRLHAWQGARAIVYGIPDERPG